MIRAQRVYIYFSIKAWVTERQSSDRLLISFCLINCSVWWKLIKEKGGCRKNQFLALFFGIPSIFSVLHSFGIKLNKMCIVRMIINYYSRMVKKIVMQRNWNALLSSYIFILVKWVVRNCF